MDFAILYIWRYSMNNNISFTAKFISPATVKKLTKNGKYVDIEVSAVKLASKNKDDLSALEKINKEWGADTYASNILDEASSTNEFYKDYRPTVYAITTQRDNFEKLEPEKVLGLAETSIEFGIIKSLDYLQTNPKFLNKVQPTIKHIGTAMLKFIENINKGHRIEIDSVKEAKAFYMKNGYKRLEEYTNIFFKDV